VEKYCTAERATDGNMADAHCMLDNKGYRHKLRIFPLQRWLQARATMLRLYVHCLPFYNFWEEDK
jgi:hypothetical protein